MAPVTMLMVVHCVCRQPQPRSVPFCQFINCKFHEHLPAASPRFVARRGKARNYVMGHSRQTSGSGAAAARWLIVLWLMQYWLNVSHWHLCQLISQTTQYLAVSFRPTPKWTKNEIVGSRGGHMPQCPIAGDATDNGNGKCEFYNAVVAKSLMRWAR